ncbi:glycosyl transferase [soil metagenome]
MALTDEKGVWEHAEFSQPRIEHGYCTDDNARALVVTSRQQPASEDLAGLADTYLRFVLAARTSSGGFHNRRDASGEWADEIGSDDSQGRAWWGLGVVANRGPSATLRQDGLQAFGGCTSFESPHLRANAYAVLGAVEVLSADPHHHPAGELLEAAVGVIVAAARARIPWPELRLTYDNARIPEALLAAGAMLGETRMIAIGVRLLEWLTAVEANGDHFSFTPVGGWTPGEPRPGFDQQPIEAWAMADACHRAWVVTGRSVWRERAIDAAWWLLGHNDTRMVLFDEATGGTGDGLTAHGVNLNRGAESTLAGVGTLQIGDNVCDTRS